MNYYVSSDDVKKAVDYFKNASFDKDDMLPLFLLSKHLGITTSYAVTYSGDRLSAEQKADFTDSIWMMGGLFDSIETCEKRGVMFPTGFKTLSVYQPKTEFRGMLGRVRDTIKQKIIPVPIYANNDSMLTLKSNYQELIEENYLKGQKISLSALAAWIFRFASFDFSKAPDSKSFTRVVEKAVRKFFKITKKDFLWLFEDDLSSKRLTPATNGITGAELRAEFAFEVEKEPEVNAAQNDDVTYSYVLDNDTVERYLALNGDNPSDSDIFSILKAKKQIVLTGVPGVGKSRYTTILSQTKVNQVKFFTESETVQFHASYSYEDFIGAEILKTDMVMDSHTNGTYVTTRKGTFLSFVDKAKDNPDKNYLLVIDELNRGNIAEIFGETILALDRNYKVTLTKEYEGTRKLQIPENLYIVGTMNTSDRNIAFLDLAIRRRFAFVPLYPNYDFLSEEVILDDVDLGNALKTINQRIVSVLKDPELVLGQSYFIPPMNEDGKYIWSYPDFKNQFNFVVLPTLREYSFNETSAVNTIVGENLADGIQDTDDFRIAFESEFSA